MMVTTIDPQTEVFTMFFTTIDIKNTCFHDDFHHNELPERPGWGRVGVGRA